MSKTFVQVLTSLHWEPNPNPNQSDDCSKKNHEEILFHFITGKPIMDGNKVIIVKLMGKNLGKNLSVSCKSLTECSKT
jgi:hypothetical protein